MLHILNLCFRFKVYLRQANAVKELLIESLRESPVRLAVVLKKSPLRSTASARACGGGGGGSVSTIRQRRVGAFEVQVNPLATAAIVVDKLFICSGKLLYDCGRLVLHVAMFIIWQPLHSPLVVETIDLKGGLARICGGELRGHCDAAGTLTSACTPHCLGISSFSECNESPNTYSSVLILILFYLFGVDRCVLTPTFTIFP